MNVRENRRKRRLQRHERNKTKDQEHKKEAWESGKLIEPNHNGNYYPAEYSMELGMRLVDKDFQKYRLKIRDYLLLCPKEARDDNWTILKGKYDSWLENKIKGENIYENNPN